MWILTFSIGMTKFGFFPAKTLIFLLFICFSTCVLVERNYTIIKHKLSLGVLGLWLVVAIFVGIVNGFDASTLNQATSLIAAFLVVIFAFVLHENGLLNTGKIQSTIYLTAITGTVVKALLGLGVVLGFLSADGIDALMQNYAGSTSFNADALGGFLGLLPRIGNAGDLFNLIVFMFYAKKHSGIRVFLFWILMLVFVLVTYSRYLILFFTIASLYAVASNIKEKSKAMTVALVFALLSIFLYYSDADVIYLEIENRFTGQIQSESDAIRTEMKTILLTTFENNSIVGIGIGGYVKNYLRSPTNLWQYELEYLSLLMQLGILGFLCIVINFVAYVIRTLFTNHDSKFIWPMIAGTIFWLGTPIQSSLFSGTQSALIILTLFFLSGNASNRQAQVKAATYRAQAIKMTARPA